MKAIAAVIIMDKILSERPRASIAKRIAVRGIFIIPATELHIPRASINGTYSCDIPRKVSPFARRAEAAAPIASSGKNIPPVIPFRLAFKVSTDLTKIIAMSIKRVGDEANKDTAK